MLHSFHGSSTTASQKVKVTKINATKAIKRPVFAVKISKRALVVEMGSAEGILKNRSTLKRKKSAPQSFVLSLDETKRQTNRNHFSSALLLGSFLRCSIKNAEERVPCFELLITAWWIYGRKLIAQNFIKLKLLYYTNQYYRGVLDVTEMDHRPSAINTLLYWATSSINTCAFFTYT